MYRQIQVINKFKTGREKNLQSFFGRDLIKNIKICEKYKFNENLSKKNYQLACELLSNPISQQVFSKNNTEKILKKFGNFSWILEIGYLPGVTPNGPQSPLSRRWYKDQAVEPGQNSPSQQPNGRYRQPYLKVEGRGLAARSQPQGQNHRSE